MLEMLRRLVQEVSNATDLTDALKIIVARIREAMQTEVCSVYIYDAEASRYILMATEGLNPESVGKVSLNASQGLVGLVGSREEPINVDNAPQHPKFHFVSETGEAPFLSFLGVPIIHHKRLLGVLVVQQRDSRQFDVGEEAFLVTMSVQLAGVIAQAEATGNIINDSLVVPRERKKNTRFLGVPGSPGVGLGVGHVLSPLADLHAVVDHDADDVEQEIQRFEKALGAARAEIRTLEKKLSSELRSEELSLFDVYLDILDDNMLGKEVSNKIREENLWAQGALKHVVLQYVAQFQQMEDVYLRERASDIQDLGTRVLAHLQGMEPAWREDDFPANTILVSEELTAGMLGVISTKKLRGLVSVHGSSNSHVAILARSLGIPCVMGVDVPYAQLQGVELVVDGYRGILYSNPNRELRRQYREIFKEEKELEKGLRSLRDLPAETLDGKRMPLFVNTGLITDAVRSIERGAEGVGLYRTEVPFMIRERFPSEAEQQELYRQQLETFYPKPVTMRTLDIGGDKPLPYYPIAEDNPFLGWRGVRVTLDHPEIFLPQLRAMLKASEGLNNLRIMLPMVSSVHELEEAKYLVHRAYSELLEEGHCIEKPPIGMMVEVPATIFQIQSMCHCVDFISVGSNDLTQYLLAVDRNNPKVAQLYQAYHPAVLKALKFIAEQAKAAGTSASVCGELAGDPMGAVLLMAMGYDELSMNATNLPKVKAVLRGISKAWAHAVLEDVMTIDSAPVITATLQLALEKAGFSRIMGPAL